MCLTDEYESIFLSIIVIYLDEQNVYFQIPNWTGQMNGSSDEEDESPEGQRMTTNSNSHLRKCLLCNIEVKKKELFYFLAVPMIIHFFF